VGARRSVVRCGTVLQAGRSSPSRHILTGGFHGQSGVGAVFLIGIVGGGVQLGTAATNRPVVPASGDYDDGEIAGMNSRGNRSTWRKPAPARFVHHSTRTRAAAVGCQRLTA
jgi:hypothetical protein